MLEIASGALPVSLRVDVWVGLVVPTSWDANDRLAGVRVAAGAAGVPVPLSATVCGFPAASSLTLTVARRLPWSVGVKVTEIVQVALTARLAGQLLDCAKSDEFGPATVIPEMASGAVPEFRRVEACAAPVVPWICDPKLRLVGVSVTAGCRSRSAERQALRVVRRVVRDGERGRPRAGRRSAGTRA